MSKNNDVVIIELDRPRKLRFGYGAMKALEAHTGKTIAEMDETIGELSTANIGMLVYFGLTEDREANNENMTMEEVGNLLDKAPYFTYPLEKAIQAWRMAFNLPAVPTLPEGNDQPPNQSAEVKKSTGRKA